jgi:hypothetical protein
MSYHYVASKYYPTIQVLKSIDSKRAAANESISRIIWGREFLLVPDNNSNIKVAIRFISPVVGHEWPIYIRVKVLIVADKIQQLTDDLTEPSLELINNRTPYVLMTY